MIVSSRPEVPNNLTLISLFTCTKTSHIATKNNAIYTAYPKSCVISIFIARSVVYIAVRLNGCCIRESWRIVSPRGKGWAGRFPKILTGGYTITGSHGSLFRLTFRVSSGTMRQWFHWWAKDGSVAAVRRGRGITRDCDRFLHWLMIWY